MLARSFLFESSSKLLVTRTGIKAWSSSNLVQIRQLILELLALEWRKFHTFELEYLWSEVANLDQILCVASLGWGKGCIKVLGLIDLGTLDSGERSLPFGLLVGKKWYILEETLGLISRKLTEDKGEFTFWCLLLGIFFFNFQPRVFFIMFMLFLYRNRLKIKLLRRKSLPTYQP